MMLRILMESKFTPTAILFFGFTLRLFGLFSRPIWYDEAFSLLFANTSPNAMIYGTLTPGGTGSADIHPLGYYFLLWAWTRIVGNGVVTARLLSILISIFSLILVYQIAKQLFNEKVGRLSLFLAAILPFQVHYAQEIRMYALLELFLLLATFSYLKGRKGHWAWWILFGLSCAAAQFTHNLAAFYLIPLAATAIFEKDHKALKSVILAGLFAILLYTPWLIHLPNQLSKVSTAYWVERPGLEKIFTLILLFLPHLPIPDQLLLPCLLISTLIIVFMAIETFRSTKEPRDSTGHAKWAVYLAIMPPIFLWVTSQFIPVYIERALLPSHAMFCIGLAWAISNSKLGRIVQITILVLIVLTAAIGIHQHINFNRFPYGPYATVANNLENNVKTEDMIVHSNKLSYLPTFYYNTNLEQFYISDPKGSKTDTLAPATQTILNLKSLNDIKDIASSTKRIWYIIFQESINEYIDRGLNSHPDLEFLNKHYNLESIKEWGDIRIYLYTRKGFH